MTITAHSGAFGTPDNSLEYVKKVLEEHCEIFEIDVTFRPDGTPVVIHSGSPKADEGVLLEEVFALTAEDPAIRMNLDLKSVKNLPAVDGECKDIAYVWEEPAAGIGYKLTGNVVTGDKTVGTLTTLTNSREADKVPVSVRKVWTDDNDAAKKRPASIEVQLYADGKAEGAPVVLNAANGWTYTWEGLSKNIRENGLTRAIAYTVAETEIPEGYVGKVSGNAGDGFVITNTWDTGKLVIEKEFDIQVPPPEPETEEETT